MKLSWAITPEIMGVAALCAGDVAAFQSAANPSIFTMRTFRSDQVSAMEQDNTKNDILLGSAIGAGLALVTGAGGTAVTKSYWPFAATLIALVVLVGVNLWAIENPHNMRKNIADQA